MTINKTIALVAHDMMKMDMVEWVRWNKDIIMRHRIVCTGTTGKLIRDTLIPEKDTLPQKDFEIIRLKSGPLGGDQQLGAMIAERKIDILIFFWDPMQPQPHDVDVKALLRIAVLYNIPTASNRATADFLISSPFFNQSYKVKQKNYQDYLNRTISGIK
jgi:methylglyoxal synthase